MKSAVLVAYAPDVSATRLHALALLGANLALPVSTAYVECRWEDLFATTVARLADQVPGQLCALDSNDVPWDARAIEPVRIALRASGRNQAGSELAPSRMQLSMSGRHYQRFARRTAPMSLAANFSQIS